MSRKPNRHYLLCPLCLKTKDFLSVHLRRVCMKDSTPEAIGAAVEKAKKDVHDLLVSGRVFPYLLLCQILDDADPLSRLTEELQRRHMVVTGIPPPLPNANVIARPSTTQTAESAAPETGESEPSDNTSVSSGKCFQFVSTVQWTTKNRKLMAQRGLYQRHSLDYPLLKDFGLYLERELCNENFKQEEEGGQGLVHLASRGAAFRLQYIQRLLTGPMDLVWRAASCCILKQCGGLGLGLPLFVMDSSKLNTSPLPAFYRSVFTAWSLPRKQRQEQADSLCWLLQELVLHGGRLDSPSRGGPTLHRALHTAGDSTLSQVVEVT
ncbi:uncharacterized protein LOC143316317 [Chaetodon auriga]|uniref:uncharacterized protein LOC143316317 n=1 Tax=Chaetodon auriga TaxID=39042 RepID=UPI004033107E